MFSRLRNLRHDARQLPAAGDHAGFAAFYRHYEGAVLAYMQRRLRDPELAADLTMEVFAAALIAVNRETRPQADAVSWLFGIARHKLVDSYRSGVAEDRAQRRLGIDPLALSDDDLERINELTDEAKVLQHLERLPPEQREAVKARIIEDRDYDAIAHAAGTTSMVVRQRVSRGLRTLKSELKEAR